MTAHQQAHRATLKQQNKKHNKLGHKTKGQVKAIIQGRTGSLLTISRKAKHELSRLERRHQVKLIRSNKREKTLNQKRSLGTDLTPPFLVCVVMLSPDINPRLVLSALSKADARATVTTSKQGNTHVSSTMLKQRFTFTLPPINDMYAILDAMKVSSTCLFVWPGCERGEEILGEDQQLLLSAIKAQGLPTPLHAVVGMHDLPQKRKSSGYQNLLEEVNHYFPGHAKAKVFQLDKPGDPILCLRSLGCQKHRSLFYRDHRPHLMAETVQFIDNPTSASSGTLRVSGYLRGITLSPSSIVHIPGWGDYHLDRVAINTQDPHPLLLNGNRKGKDGEDLILYPDSEHLESLVPTQEGEDSDDDEEDSQCSTNVSSSLSQQAVEQLTAVPKRMSKVPKAVNAYMAAWYNPDVDYDDVNSDESEGEDTSEGDEEDDEDDEFNAPDPMDNASTVCGDDLEDRMSIVSGSEWSVNDDNYDEKVDYIDEMDEYQRMMETRDDLEFPDEVDTPRDEVARKRFHKYRGLESFRSSPWDLSEGLPEDYNRVYQINNFEYYRKAVMKLLPKGERPEVGEYIEIDIKNIEKHLYLEHIKSGSPLVVFGLLYNEVKMSVANYALKAHSSLLRDIKSKDKLIFHVGFRRFVNQPIFSEHTLGDKHKFCRFFRAGMTVVASMYAPITYPPASVMAFRQLPNGKQALVATGSVYSYDTERCVLKRVILSGHPFKIHKRSAVIRYMFFDREDINWYKPVELRTKYGNKGKIKEPLGTHGHMKCVFNGIIKSQDTVLLTLYKRMFPKWNYNTFVPRPTALYSKGTFDAKEEEEDEQELEQLKERRDKFLMPPPAKKPKKVHFS